MNYYPIYLNLMDKRAVVIGGGKVAERKIQGLMEARALITVVSPELTEKLHQYYKAGNITWKKKTFSAEDIKDAFLIIAAANDPEVSFAVKKAAAPNQLLNLADNPEESNFILPSVYKQGKLSMTVSTSGASPTLAKKIKQNLASQYGPEYRDYVDFLYDCRKWILQEITDSKLKKYLLSAITEREFVTSTNRQKDFKDLLDKWNQS
ncbi:NAD(P)-binding protein [Niallia endozanthoxylica]|uniref:precorrin-2 dehydrogenase n=1 Tax=Niallia endozanthoxylica TaxID=2036016 RepID=A0A5J5I405_9BACI|nr:NAD(P)-binding protein [Niallia endozanthoxylica]KAA9031204.1 NAD(P)-binding protein [Niallia endozanthoxylica]